MSNPDELGGVRLPSQNLTGHRTVAGLFARQAEAHRAVRELKAAGFVDEQIGLALCETGGPDGIPLCERIEPDEVIEPVLPTVGAIGGSLIGGWVGLLAGLSALVIPGLGPVLAGGVLGSVLVGAGLGAAGGGVVGALVRTGLSESEAQHFDNGLQSGGILVTVRTTGRVPEVLGILQRCGADTGPDDDDASTFIQAQTTPD